MAGKRDTRSAKSARVAAKRPAATVASQQRRIGTRKRPAASRTKVPTAHGRGLAILRQLQRGTSNDKAQLALTRAIRSIRAKNNEEFKADDALLEVVLREVADSLEQEVQDAQAAVASQTEALASAKVAAVELKARLAEAQKSIKMESKGIPVAKAEQKKVLASCKELGGTMVALNDVWTNVFQPLKDASLQGSEASSSLRQLHKVGARAGFHEGLLGVMGKALKRSLSRRQTFDKIVVQSVDKEFAKQSAHLISQLQTSRCKAEELGKTVKEKTAVVAQAKLELKRNCRNAAAVRSPSTCLPTAAKSRRSIPSVKTATRHLKRVQSKNGKLLMAINKYRQWSGALV